MTADNNSQKQTKGRPFSKGESGNPQGRPVGALNKTNRIVQELISDKAGDIIQKVSAAIRITLPMVQGMAVISLYVRWAIAEKVEREPAGNKLGALF